MTESDSSQPLAKSFPFFWILMGALPAFLPLLHYWGDFSKYFYMGDEWAQLHQIDAWGYWTWVFSFFGENFMPVFKLVWSAILFLGDGSYFLFILVQFQMHSLVVFLLGYLLRQWGLSWFVVLFSQWVMALSHTHIEILMQSIQMSNLLSYSFLLLLSIYVSDRVLNKKGFSNSSCLMIAMLSLLGALSFSRGLLNGSAVFATFALFGLMKKPITERWLAPALSALVPCVAVALLTAYAVFGATSSSSDGLQVVETGKHFYYHLSLNPFFQQLRGLEISFGLTVKLLIANAMVLVMGLLYARSRLKALVVFFVFFFLGNGLLLSLGRSHTSLDTVASWRYQYGVLLCFAPVVAILVDRLLGLIRVSTIRLVLQIVIICWISGRVYDHWELHSPVWSESRGTEIREAASAENIDPEAISISRFLGVTDERAIELIKKYHLH
ncbi:MAG: hypothetical protein P8L44_01350 [Opitutales bacterium]|nr:hypothetical protein [Opitutales bacterium]